MKILKKVSAREVKRTFVIGNDIRIQKNGRRYLGKISEKEFLKKLQQSKQRGLRMTNTQLDRRIEDPQRLREYDALEWHLGEVAPSEVGVWKKAGGLPLSWTNGSLKDTSSKVSRALENNSKSLAKRSRRAITNMLATNVGLLQTEKYLLPIVFEKGAKSRARRGLKRQMKGAIDDGCMRSIALAVHGEKVIRAYIGFPKKVRAVH